LFDVSCTYDKAGFNSEAAFRNHLAKLARKGVTHYTMEFCGAGMHPNGYSRTVFPIDSPTTFLEHYQAAQAAQTPQPAVTA
jgi:hypothetical protein